MAFTTKVKEIMSPQKSTWKHKFNWKYQDLSAENTDSDEEQSSPCLEKGLPPPQQPSPRPWSRIIAFLPWLLTIILLISTVIQATHSHEKCLVPESDPIGSFSHGFATDFYPVKSQIKSEQVRFTGSPAFLANGSMFLPNPDERDYTSDTPEVDEAWEDLTRGRYILITEEEASRTWGPGYEQYYDPNRGGYIAGLDMFHTLHCVNRLRKMTPETLASTLSAHNSAMHYHHCFSQIRQHIMCAGDMTPIPTKYYPAIGRNYVDSDMVHTCRNFKQLREWTTERYNANAIDD